MPNKIRELIEGSKEVILECSLKNGAIVAANTDNPRYPKHVANYRWVWPRDAAFVLYAARLLGINTVQKPFLRWLLERAELFRETGMVFQNYATHGVRQGSQYQADQAGSLLWAICEIFGRGEKLANEVVTLLANGICNAWNGRNFSEVVWDLWEERCAIPDLRENFIYSLASCSFGLRKAYERLKEKTWLKVSRQMRKIIIKAGETFGYYPRSFGKISDKRIDASLLGLVWPFEVVEKDAVLKRTVHLIETKLLTPLGVKRYEHDEYGDMVEYNIYLRKGAGGWPLLTFWYCTALFKLGEERRARRIFKNYLRRIEGRHIPEHLFEDRLRKSVLPLAWAHATIVAVSGVWGGWGFLITIAAETLGYLR